MNARGPIVLTVGADFKNVSHTRNANSEQTRRRGGANGKVNKNGASLERRAFYAMPDEALTRVAVQHLVAPFPLLLLPLQGIRRHPAPADTRGDAAHEPRHVPVLQRALVPGLLEQRADRVHDRGHVRQEVLVRFWFERAALVPLHLYARGRCGHI